MSNEYLFANVRPESKYYPGQHKDKPFKVTLNPDPGGYHWSGGPGGQYRTPDLVFYVKREQKFIELDLCESASLTTLKVVQASIKNGAGKGWHSEYWKEVRDMASSILELARNEYSYQLKREADEDYE